AEQAEPTPGGTVPHLGSRNEEPFVPPSGGAQGEQQADGGEEPAAGPAGGLRRTQPDGAGPAQVLLGRLRIGDRQGEVVSADVVRTGWRGHLVRSVVLEQLEVGEGVEPDEGDVGAGPRVNAQLP